MCCQDLERNLQISQRLFEGIMGLLGPYQQAASAQKVDKFVTYFFLTELVTFRVRRSRGEMYSGHCRLCVCVPVCLSVPWLIPTLLHGPGCKLGEWYVVPSSCALWANLQLLHGFRCYET